MTAPSPLIAHIVYTLSTGGMENGLINIINRMPPGRYRHAIICITSADQFAQRIAVPGVQIIELHKRAGHDPAYFLRLRKALADLSPSIIHSRNLAALEAQLAGIGLRGVKRIHGEHGRDVHDLDGRNWKYLVLRKFMRPFIHRYIAVSKDLAEWLIEIVKVRPSRVHHIYNGVDHDRFRPGTVKPLALLPERWRDLDGILIVGSVGRLAPVKDQQLLIRAICALRRERPALGRRVRLLLVGEGPLRSDLERLVKDLALGDVVWLPGNRDDVASLLAAMDVFVLPSLGEGISNTILEAMATGVPVVATAVGGNVELVRPGFNGALVPVGSEKSLADALSLLLEDDAERRRLGDNARQMICHEFDWDNTVASYLRVYDELVGKGSSHAVGEN